MIQSKPGQIEQKRGRGLNSGLLVPPRYPIFPKNKEIGVIFPRVDLAHYPAHPGAILPKYNKEVFCHEMKTLAYCHNLHVRKALTIRADLILAFDDKDAPFSQDPLPARPPSSYSSKTAA